MTGLRKREKGLSHEHKLQDAQNGGRYDYDKEDGRERYARRI